MQKAYLYEAILLVNQGIDDAARGLERLKRAKDSGLNPPYCDEKLTLFEVHRALLNSYFCNVIEGRAPKVRFLSFEKQQAWERQYPKPPEDVRDETQHRKGEPG